MWLSPSAYIWTEILLKCSTIIKFNMQIKWTNRLLGTMAKCEALPSILPIFLMKLNKFSNTEARKQISINYMTKKLIIWFMIIAGQHQHSTVMDKRIRANHADPDQFLVELPNPSQHCLQYLLIYSSTFFILIWQLWGQSFHSTWQTN